MDATEFLQAVPDLVPILRNDEDAHQDVMLHLWEKRDSIRNMPHYARRVAKRAASDASKRRRRENSRIETWETRHERASESASPLDRMIEAEDRARFHAAAAELPQCQRHAVAIEIDPARRSSEVEAKPPYKSHRPNLYKATKRLKEWLAADDAQDMRAAAPSDGSSPPRCCAVPSTTPSKASMVPVDPATTTKEGSTRAVDPSATTVEPLTATVESSTGPVEPSTTAVDPSKKGAGRATATIDRARARGSCARHVSRRGFSVAEHVWRGTKHNRADLVRMCHSW